MTGDKWGIGRRKIEFSKTLFKVGERNGASPDDLTMWEEAKVAKLKPQLDNNVIGVLEVTQRQQ